jgi:hypothetical protein
MSTKNTNIRPKKTIEYKRNTNSREKNMEYMDGECRFENRRECSILVHVVTVHPLEIAISSNSRLEILTGDQTQYSLAHSTSRAHIPSTS